MYPLDERNSDDDDLAGSFCAYAEMTTATGEQRCGEELAEDARLTGHEPGRSESVEKARYEKAFESTDAGTGTQVQGVTFLLILSTLSVTLGGSFLFGFNMGVLSVASVHMQNFFNESHYHRRGAHLEEESSRWLWSSTVAMFCTGAVVGACISGYPSNKYGRKKTIIGNNIFSVSGALLMSLSFLAHSYEMVMIGRFLVGVNVGLVTAVVPMYLSEISPTPLRGLISIMHGVQINIGVAVSQALGLYVFTGEDSWPWLLGVPVIVISLFQFTTFLFCPETPRWLLINNSDPRGAIKALKSLRRSKDVAREISEIEAENSRENESSESWRGIVSIWDLVCLRQREWRKPLVLTIVCNCGAQLTGVNAIWFYLIEIFQSAGLNATQIGMVTVWLGIGNAIVTIISGYSFDRFGRRPVILGALLMCVVILCGVTACMVFQDSFTWLPWLSAALVGAHTFMVSLGPGPAPFVLCTEIWSQAPRGSAMAFGSQISWLTNFLVGILFPTMQKTLGPYTFLIFAAVSAIILVYFWFELPETKNKTFEEINDSFRQKAGLSNRDYVRKIYPKTTDGLKPSPNLVCDGTLI